MQIFVSDVPEVSGPIIEILTNSYIFTNFFQNDEKHRVNNQLMYTYYLPAI